MHCVRCCGASPTVTHSKIELVIVLSNLTLLSGLGHVWRVRLAKLELTFPFDTLRDRGLCGEYRIWFELSSSCDGMGSPGGSCWWHWRGLCRVNTQRLSLGCHECLWVIMDAALWQWLVTRCVAPGGWWHVPMSLHFPMCSVSHRVTRHQLLNSSPSDIPSPGDSHQEHSVTRSLLSEEKQALKKIYSARVTLTAHVLRLCKTTRAVSYDCGLWVARWCNARIPPGLATSLHHE